MNFISLLSGRLLASLWLALLPLLALAANPVLLIQGGNPNGGDNTAFVDNVEVWNATTNTLVSGAVTNPSFEDYSGIWTGWMPANPGSTNSYGYQPDVNVTAWVLAGSAGLAQNGSGFGPPTTSYGNNTALLQGATATARQTLALPAGRYYLKAQVGQRAGNTQRLDFFVAGVLVGSAQPASNTNIPWQSATFGVDVLPAVTAVSPIAAGTGGVLTLTGINLAGTSSITFTGTAGPKTVTSGFTVNAAGTQITGVVVPAGAQSGPVRIIASSGTSTAGGAFTFTRPKTVAAGGGHTMMIQSNGLLWAMGFNGQGQLGIGSTTDQPTAVRVGPASNWVSVAAGSNHTVAVQADGSLWTWGSNNSGQLGLGNTTDQATPQRVGTDNDWVSVSAGGMHTMALKTDGSIWGWGYNAFGQLGLGQNNSASIQPTPQRAGTGNSWISVTAGGEFTLAVQADGTLWAWGNNTGNQLGLGNSYNPVERDPVRVGTASNWVSVEGGGRHAVALQADGSLWTWGENSDGQLGNGSTSSSQNTPTRVGSDTNWASAEGGGQHTVALRSDGSVWAWGMNYHGEAGETNFPGTAPSPQRVGTANTWTSVAAGHSHGVGEQACRAVWGWGFDFSGQLGQGAAYYNTPTPVLAFVPARLLSFSPTMAFPGTTVTVTGANLQGLSALSVNGANALPSVTNLTATGFNFVVPIGALANGTTSVSVAGGCGAAATLNFTVLLPEVVTVTPFIGKPGSVVTLTGYQLTGATTITFFGSAGTRTVTSGFTVNASGTQISGIVVPVGAQSGPVTVTVGGGGTSPVGPALFSRASTLAVGRSYTLAVRTDGSLWAWGLNDYGQLGIGNTTNQTTPQRVGTANDWVSVSAGQSHTVALRTDGSLWSWGLGGLLGLGAFNNSTNHSTPQRVGTATNWASVTAGFGHTLALRADGTLWAWGSNQFGQSGFPNNLDRHDPTQVGTDTWASVVAGGLHSLGVRTDGTLWAWGRNDQGQLGLGSTTDQVGIVQVGTDTDWASVAVGEYHTVALRTSGARWGWGYNLAGQLGVGTTVRNYLSPTLAPGPGNWTMLDGGLVNTVGLQADGSLWAWGDNQRGQLGLGINPGLSRSTPQRVGTDNTWTSVAAGNLTTVAQQSCHAEWAWGDNEYGQVGDGSTTHRDVPVPVYTPTFALLSFSPASAAAGATVTVTGTGLQGLTGLSVNGADALASIRDNTATGFSFVVPAGASASGTVFASSVCGAASFPGLTVLAVPVLSSFLPPSGPVGTAVHVMGSNLSNPTTVQVNGTAGTVLSVPPPSATSFRFAVGPGSTSGPITLATAGGVATSTLTPVLRLQATGGSGGDKTVFLDQVELRTASGGPVSGGIANGSFETGASGNLTVNPTTITSWTFANNALLLNASAAGVPLSPPTAPDGAYVVALQGSSSYVEQALSLSAGTYQLRFRLAQRECCGPSFYDQAVQVSLNGVALGAALTTTTAAAFDQLVTVLFSVSSAGVFSVGSPPTVTSFFPPAAAVGQLINLTGTDLSGATAITFSGSSGNVTTTGFTVASATSITGIAVPAGAINGPVTVTAATGTGAPSAQAFTVRPSLSSLALSAGSLAPAFTAGNFSYSLTVPGTVTSTTVTPTNAQTSGGTIVVNGTPLASGATSSPIALAPGDNTLTVEVYSTSPAPPATYTITITRTPCAATATAQNVSVSLNAGGNGTLAATAVNNGSSSTCGPVTTGIQKVTVDGTVFGDVSEGGTLSLTAPAGTVFTGVSFASYGTPTGSAGSYALSSCHASSSLAVVRAYLLGKAGPVSIPATSIFGDPCPGTAKRLAVRATYTLVNPSASLAYTLAEAGDQPVLFTASDGFGGSASAVVTATVVPALTLTALSTAAELPGQALTLTGSGFTAASTVSFGGVAASVTYNSATSLTAVVPVGAAPGSRAVVVSLGGTSTSSSPAFEVLQVYRSTAASGCLTTASLSLSGSGGAGTWRYLRLPGAGGAVVAAIEDTRNLGTVTAGFQTLGTATAAAVRVDGRANRAYLDRSFYLTATNPTFTGQTVRVRFFGLSSELSRLQAVDGNATLAGLNASQYRGSNENCALADNDPSGERRLLAAPATVAAGADWFTAQVSVADHFSEFYLTAASTPLPVELRAFTAEAQGRAVALAWHTASEQNSARFEVERSENGASFTRIGTVPAAGYSSAPRAYSLPDNQLPAGAGTLYYRLRQVDLDGTASYSPVRAVKLVGKEQLTLAPNPARSAVAVGGLQAGALVEVFDALGRAVATVPAQADGTACLLLPAGLAPGVYLVRSGAQVRRLVVE